MNPLWIHAACAYVLLGNDDLVNIYTRVDFMKYYMGVDLYSYREDLIYADWYDEMPSYPDPGSIMMRSDENRIIIKLN